MIRDNYLHFENLMEIVGVLYELEACEGVLLAKVGRITAVLPAEMEAILNPLIGQKIGILKIDGKYLHRIIPAEKSNASSLTIVAGRNLAEEIC